MEPSSEHIHLVRYEKSEPQLMEHQRHPSDQVIRGLLSRQI